MNILEANPYLLNNYFKYLLHYYPAVYFKCYDLDADFWPYLSETVLTTRHKDNKFEHDMYLLIHDSKTLAILEQDQDLFDKYKDSTTFFSSNKMSNINYCVNLDIYLQFNPFTQALLRTKIPTCNEYKTFDTFISLLHKIRSFRSMYVAYITDKAFNIDNYSIINYLLHDGKIFNNFLHLIAQQAIKFHKNNIARSVIDYIYYNSHKWIHHNLVKITVFNRKLFIGTIKYNNLEIFKYLLQNYSNIFNINLRNNFSSLLKANNLEYIDFIVTQYDQNVGAFNINSQFLTYYDCELHSDLYDDQYDCQGFCQPRLDLINYLFEHGTVENNSLKFYSNSNNLIFDLQILFHMNILARNDSWRSIQLLLEHFSHRLSLNDLNSKYHSDYAAYLNNPKY